MIVAYNLQISRLSPYNVIIPKILSCHFIVSRFFRFDMIGTPVWTRKFVIYTRHWRDCTYASAPMLQLINQLRYALEQLGVFVFGRRGARKAVR